MRRSGSITALADAGLASGSGETEIICRFLCGAVIGRTGARRRIALPGPPGLRERPKDNSITLANKKPELSRDF